MAILRYHIIYYYILYTYYELENLHAYIRTVDGCFQKIRLRIESRFVMLLLLLIIFIKKLLLKSFGRRTYDSIIIITIFTSLGFYLFREEILRTLSPPRWIFRW